jgi:hypothetical protein
VGEEVTDVPYVINGKQTLYEDPEIAHVGGVGQSIIKMWSERFCFVGVGDDQVD